jgi:hypothetical protein
VVQWCPLPIWDNQNWKINSVANGGNSRCETDFLDDCAIDRLQFACIKPPEKLLNFFYLFLKASQLGYSGPVSPPGQPFSALQKQQQKSKY